MIELAIWQRCTDNIRTMKNNIQNITYKKYDVIYNGRAIASVEYPSDERNSHWYNIKVWTPEGGFIKSAQHLTEDGYQFDLVAV